MSREKARREEAQAQGKKVASPIAPTESMNHTGQQPWMRYCRGEYDGVGEVSLKLLFFLKLKYTTPLPEVMFPFAVMCASTT